MLSSWKRFVNYSHHQFSRRVLSSVQQNQVYDKNDQLTKTFTFKQRTFAFFQTNAKYKELCITPDQVFQLLQSTADLRPESKLKNKPIDLPVANSSQRLKNLSLANDFRIEQLEDEPASILSSCNGKEALLIGHAVYQIVGEPFKKGNFYGHLLSKAQQWIETCATKEELVLWAFLCSLDSSQKPNVTCLRTIYERFKVDAILFQNLSTFETSIICNAWFTNNITVSSKPMLRAIEQLLRNQIVSSLGIINQETLSMLKVLRKAGFGTDLLFDSLISSLSSSPARNLNLAQMTHSLALLADHRCLINNELVDNITHLVEANAKKPMQSPNIFLHPSRGTRVKDLTRFLWTASCLIPADADSRERIATLIIEQVEAGWKGGCFLLEKDVHLLSDFFLSLACWQIYPQSLIEKVINRSFVDVVIKQQQSVRQSRLALFMVAAQIEAPNLKLDRTLLSKVAFNLPPYRVEKELVKRPHLSRLAAVMDRYKEQLGWENIHCSSTVPHLNFAGLTFDCKGEKVAVEVLDPYVCMRHSNRPERLLALKIRLSEQLGYRVIQLDVQQLNRKQQEAVAQDDSFIDQQLTKIRKCLENDNA